MSSSSSERASTVVGHLAPLRASSQTATSSSIPLESLFNYSRLKRPLSTIEKFILLLYSPLGITLIVVRLITWCSVFASSLFMPAALARRVIPWMMVPISGLWITHKHVERRDSPNRPQVIIGNHLSDLDAYVIPMSGGNMHTTRPVISTVSTTVPLLGTFIRYGYRPWSPLWVPPKSDNADSRRNLREQIVSAAGTGANRTTDFPIGILPEGGLTNGTVGLLLFKKFIFSLGLPVQPIAVRIKSPWPCNVDYLSSKWIYNLLYTFFMPFHLYEVSWLAPMSQAPDETPEQFAKRVQVAVAKELGIVPTDYTYEDKVRLRIKLYGK